MEPKEIDAMVASLDDKRLRLLFDQLMQDIDGLTSLDLQHDQQIRGVYEEMRVWQRILEARIMALEVEVRELQGDIF